MTKFGAGKEKGPCITESNARLYGHTRCVGERVRHEGASTIAFATKIMSSESKDTNEKVLRETSHEGPVEWGCQTAIQLVDPGYIVDMQRSMNDLGQNFSMYAELLYCEDLQ